MRDRRPVPGLLALCLLLAATSASLPPIRLAAQESPVQGGPVERRQAFAVAVVDSLGEPVTQVRPGDLSALLEGRAQEISSCEPVAASATPYRVLLYSDPALVDPESLKRGIDLLAARVGKLARLGAVEVVLGGAQPESLSPPTSDPAQLRQHLEALGDEADWAGDLMWLRQSGDPGTSEEESALLRGSRDGLLERLAEEPVDRPSLLLLLQDEAPAEDDAARGELRDLLAGLGWTVVALSATDGSARQGEGERLLALAEATGGYLVGDGGDLDAALGELAKRWALELRLTGLPASAPMRLSLGSRNPSWTVRGPRVTFLTLPEELSEARLRAILEGRLESLGRLPVSARLRPGAADRRGEGPLLEVLLDLRRSPPASPRPRFRVSMGFQASQQPRTSLHFVERATEIQQGIEGWLYRRPVSLPQDLDRAIVVVEELDTGRWGASSLMDGPSSGPWDSPALVVQEVPSAAVAGQGSVGPSPPPVIRLVGPAGSPVSGRTRFRALVASGGVARAVFYLDGQQVAEDARPPFTATIQLAEPPRPQTVRVEAFSISGLKLGEDRVELNRSGEPPGVRIVSMRLLAESRLEVEIVFRPPEGEELAGIDLFLNDRLVQSLAIVGPFRTELSVGSLRPQDYLRAVARLVSGRELEDAQLILEPAAAERLEVNLVEVYAVVTRAEGGPVTDLQREDFRVRFRGRAQPVERFGPAQEVPLLLGLVIDTSQSMWPLMPDTKQAGARFLVETLKEGDRAYLVDFDTRPRLAQGTTADLTALLRRFGGLEADGWTALYDAIVFSMLQFEEEPGRKALVVLTDGDDYRSQFGPRKCIEYGRALGVPVYIISLGGLQDPRRGLQRIDLEAVAEGTGGRVFYPSSAEDLGGVYEQINRELRSQYLLAFTTDEPLSDEELRLVEVEVEGQGLEVRIAIGRQQR